MEPICQTQLIVELRFSSVKIKQFTELFSSKRDTVSPVLSLGLLAWDSKMAAHQQFLRHIYWNFMGSGISGIGIWLSL